MKIFNLKIKVKANEQIKIVQQYKALELLSKILRRSASGVSVKYDLLVIHRGKQ